MEDLRATRELYDGTAGSWSRNSPSSLSDFTARPFVLELCQPLVGARVLDLGCGEGYCARQMVRAGAADVLGIDLSEAMIQNARAEELRMPLGIRYEQGDATGLARIENHSLDLVVAVFLFNYLTRAQTTACMKEVARVLRSGGKFVFAVPHPAFPFMRRPAPPFYFDLGDQSYFSARDTRFAGKIWKRDGSALDVQVVHKTVEDYFTALSDAGFHSLPKLRELSVTDDIHAVDPTFFGPLLGAPLHIAFALQR